MLIRVRRGLEANRLSITPRQGEFIYTTDTKKVYIGDDVTPGGTLVDLNQVLSVAGKTGDVILVKDDVGLSNVPNVDITNPSNINQDTTHRFVSDTEKTAWNNKSNFSGSYNDLDDKPFIPDELSELIEDTTHRTVTDTEKSTWNAKQNALTADVDYLTPTTASSTYEPLLPATPTDPELKYLNGNRQFAPIAIGGGGFAGNLYYTTIPSDIPGYYKLSYTPEVSETILSGVVQNNEVLFRTYLFDSAIDTSIIDGGVWGSVPWLRVSSATGVTRVKIEIFVRHTNGTETTLFSGYTEEINNTTIARFKSETTQQSYIVDPNDRLGARVYGTTTSNAAVTIYSVVGDGNASYFTTPIRIRHNQLRSLNEDPNYQHITSTDRTILTNINQWQSWTPSTTGISNLSLAYAKYQIDGKNIKFRAEWALTGTSAVSASFTFTLPATPSSDYVASTSYLDGKVSFFDYGTTAYFGELRYQGTNIVACLPYRVSGTSISYTVISSTVPHTWAVNDRVMVYGQFAI